MDCIVTADVRIDRYDGRVTLLLHTTGSVCELPALWLRERACDAASRDPRTGQRLFDPHSLPADLSLVDARDPGGDRLHLAFSDGAHVQVCRHELLEELTSGAELPVPRPWRPGADAMPDHDWAALDEDAGLLAAVTSFLRHGFIRLRNAPTAADSVLAVAGRFGMVFETNFGRLFRVEIQPQGNDLAYAAIGLGPHTDNPYREPVPGIQILLCRENGAAGGLSTLADGLAVGEALRDVDPGAFRMMAETPVRFHFADSDTELTERRPVIATDGQGAITGLHYSPRLDFPPLMSSDDYRRYHAARRALAQLLADPAFEVRFRLAPGDAIMFDNRRILHGRTAYEPSTGVRCLEGCYINVDGPRSHYRVLSRRLQRRGEPTGEAA